MQRKIKETEKKAEEAKEDVETMKKQQETMFVGITGDSEEDLDEDEE